MACHFLRIDPDLFGGFPGSERYPRQIYYRLATPLLLPDQDILAALYGTKICLADTMFYNHSDRILTIHNLDPRREKRDIDWVRDGGWTIQGKIGILSSYVFA